MTEPIEHAVAPTSIGAIEPEIVRTSQKQRWRVSVSLEFDLQPVLTWCGQIERSTPIGAASAGIKAARKANPGKKPRSWAIVLEKM